MLREHLKTIQDQLGHSSIVLTADTYTSVLHAAQHKAAEATARLVLDAARNDRNKIANVARRIRVAARECQKASPRTPAADQGHHSSPAISQIPEAITGHGNHTATTVHTELDQHLYPLLRGRARRDSNSQPSDP
jgi:hypothetical protein